jgi:hypothetical protein
MVDPLADVVTLLRPRAVFSKGIEGAGRWAVRYAAFGEPSFCAVFEGRCRLAVDGEDARMLVAGDFVLLPATPAFTLSSPEPGMARHIDPRAAPAPEQDVRHGRRDGPPDVRLLGGYFAFASPDAALLVSLLPALVHLGGVERGWSARRRARSGRAGTSCSRASSRCCSSRRCARRRAAARRPGCCAGWPTRG